jgi:hypothetical protein
MKEPTITEFFDAYAKACESRPGPFDHLYLLTEKERERWLTNYSQQNEVDEILEENPGLSSRAVRVEVLKRELKGRNRCRLIYESNKLDSRK